MTDRFDRAYYERYYENPRTRVAERDDADRLAAFVCAYAKYIGVPVRRALDVGCGLGLWKPEVEASFPAATYTGVEVSEYVAQRYGWVHASVNKYRPRGRFDLVICQDVFQYLDDDQAADGIERFGRWCRGLLYFAALTEEDWEHNVDQSRTDADGTMRPVSWYRERLARDFVAVGASLFIHRDADVVLFELEKA